MTWNRFGTVPEYWAGLCGYVNLCDPIPRQPKEMRMAPHIIWVGGWSLLDENQTADRILSELKRRKLKSMT